MKCYNHDDVDAVGICKHCQKGLCKECIEEVDGSLACKVSCVEEVETLNYIVNRSKNMVKHAGSQWNPAIIGSFVFGVFFFGLGFRSEGMLSMAMYIFGLGFCAISLYYYIIKKRMSKQD
ncbi:MAG: hypothetical protein COA73_02565 [Candidatus Hydrogenedentota bacterium]|nr:MAG: hypothetical protein COA73_02565 [Candidatus Hydrogenedentota bacterium]